MCIAATLAERLDTSSSHYDPHLAVLRTRAYAEIGAFEYDARPPARCRRRPRRYDLRLPRH